MCKYCTFGALTAKLASPCVSVHIFLTVSLVLHNCYKGSSPPSVQSAKCKITILSCAYAFLLMTQRDVEGDAVYCLELACFLSRRALYANLMQLMKNWYKRLYIYWTYFCLSSKKDKHLFHKSIFSEVRYQIWLYFCFIQWALNIEM